MFKLFMIVLLPLLPMRKIMLMWRVRVPFCMWIMVTMLYAYIVEFIHDPIENYYVKGTYAYRYFNNIKFPLFMLKVLKLHLLCLPMLIALCFNRLFYWNIPMRRKHVRLKWVSYFLHDALFCSTTFIPTRASLKS